MSSRLLIARFDATLLGMAVCLLAGAIADVLSVLPTAPATGGGVTRAAAFTLGAIVSEL